MKRLILILLTLFIFTNCEKENEDPKPNNNPNPKDKKDKKEDLPSLSVIDIQDESEDWDYFVISDKSDYFAFDTWETGKPFRLFYHNPEKGEFSVMLDANGLPEKLIAQNENGEIFIFLFENFNGNLVDVGVLYPNKETEIFREVESDKINWNNFSGRTAKTSDWRDVVKWTGRVVGAIPCVTSTAATIKTVGAAWPLAVKTCVPYIFGLAAEIAQETNPESGFAKFVEKYELAKLAVDCSNLNESCFSGLADLAIGHFVEHISKSIEERVIVEDLERKLQGSPPVADFVADKTEIEVGETIEFIDLSTNSPNDWVWGFGDGNGALLNPNPSHIYESPGTYSVSLFVENEYGSDEIAKENYIQVNETGGQKKNSCRQFHLGAMHQASIRELHMH